MCNCIEMENFLNVIRKLWMESIFYRIYMKTLGWTFKKMKPQETLYFD